MWFCCWCFGCWGVGVICVGVGAFTNERTLLRHTRHLNICSCNQATQVVCYLLPSAWSQPRPHEVQCAWGACSYSSSTAVSPALQTIVKMEAKQQKPTAAGAATGAGEAGTRGPRLPTGSDWRDFLKAPDGDTRPRVVRQNDWIEANCPARLTLMTAAKIAKDALILALKFSSIWKIFLDRGMDDLQTHHPLMVFGLENSRVVIARFDVVYFNALLGFGLFGVAELCFRQGYFRNFFFPLLVEAADYSSLCLTTRILGDVVNMIRIFRLPRGEAARLHMLRDLRVKYDAIFRRALWFIPDAIFYEGSMENRVLYILLLVISLLRLALVTFLAGAVLLARLSFVADAISFLQHDRWADGATMTFADLTDTERVAFLSFVLDLLAVATPTPAHRILRHRQLDTFSESARLMEQRLLRFASPTRYLNYAYLLPSAQLHFLLVMDERFALELDHPDEHTGGARSPPTAVETVVGWLALGACVCVVVPLAAVAWWLVDGLGWEQICAGTVLHYGARATVAGTCVALLVNIGVATIGSKHGWYFADAAAEHRLAFRDEDEIGGAGATWQRLESVES